MEWIDPRYADVMKAFKRERQERLQRGDDRPVRLFITTAPPDKH